MDRPADRVCSADADRGRSWRIAVRRLTTEINLGWWVATALPMFAATGLVGMVVLLYARWRWPDAAGLVRGGVAAAFIGAGAIAWWQARRRFESEATARVRLEESLGLHARLSAASGGVGPWPTWPEDIRSRWPVTWRWRRLAGIAACIAVMLALASWIPIAGAGAGRTHIIEKPTDVRVVEHWLEELASERLVAERSLEEIDRKIAELCERPAQRWYEHASLEAAGMLREQTAADLRALADNVARAEQAAATLEAIGASLPKGLREALARDMAAAAATLAAGGVEPAGDLARLFDAIRGADLDSLSPAELAALAERLSANRKALEEALGRCQGFERGDRAGSCPTCAGSTPCGACPACRDGMPCTAACRTCGRGAASRTGRGGVHRGRGDADLSFGAQTDLGSTRTERIDQPIDLARAAPDQVLAVVDGEHAVDATVSGPQTGGAVANPGDGGAEARIDMLLPAEQAAVRRFFQETRP